MPTYQTFINAWNACCGSIKLQGSVRFTLCDLCVLSREALDKERVQGGTIWKSEQMRTIKRGLNDHYEVGVPSRANTLGHKWCCLSTEHERAADMKRVPCVSPVCTMTFHCCFG